MGSSPLPAGLAAALPEPAGLAAPELAADAPAEAAGFATEAGALAGAAEEAAGAAPPQPAISRSVSPKIPSPPGRPRLIPRLLAKIRAQSSTPRRLLDLELVQCARSEQLLHLHRPLAQSQRVHVLHEFIQRGPACLNAVGPDVRPHCRAGALQAGPHPGQRVLQRGAVGHLLQAVVLGLAEG